LPLGLAAAVLVHYRRRWPVTVVVATSLLGTISRVAGTFLGLALLSLATRRVWRELATGCLLVAVIGIAGWFVDPYDQRSAEGIPWWVDAVPVLSFLAVFIAIGLYIGSRRELVYTLRNRAERAEAERDARAAQARTAERARIAREMHDVLAHRISQVSMHAGALAFREDLPAGQLREGLVDIRDRANEALQDLRGVLGVLRSDPSVEVRPQAGFGQIPELVEEARRAGSRINLTNTVDGQLPPEATGRALYRIVQEGITNAAKHAPGALLSVSLTGAPEQGVWLELRNAVGFRGSGTPGAGLGLIGLSERAESQGGTLAATTERGDFVVRVWLPWPVK
ncbi:MAG: histidine kinase, partial [Micrococcales bacterium]